jgi:hypothetical protein
MSRKVKGEWRGGVVRSNYFICRYENTIMKLSKIALKTGARAGYNGSCLGKNLVRPHLN